MTKYNFLVYHAQYADFLEQLRNIGVLHIATIAQESSTYETLRDKFTLQKRINKIIDFCDIQLKVDNKIPKDADKNLSIEQGIELFSQINSLRKEEEVLQQKLIASKRELNRMKVWGKYSLQKIEHITKAGYHIGFYSCQTRNYKSEWETLHNAFVIKIEGNITYFVTFTKDAITDIDAEQFKMSKFSNKELSENVINAKLLIDHKQSEIQIFAQENINNLKRLDLLIHDGINIDKVYLNTVKVADDKIMVLEGYCPNEVLENLNTMLNKEHIYYECSEPKDEDNVPIKLHNNAFSRLFEPLTGMYGIPSYQEYDPTPILAPFFLLFFAMCMGDGGYGILITLFGLGVKYKKINIDMFSGMGNLITVLGIGTTIVGFILGTAFGIDLYTASYIPDSLKSIMIKGEIAGYDIQMALAIAIGVVHICLAISIKAVGHTQRYGFMKTLSTWGWLFLIIGSLITSTLMLAGTFSVEATKIAFVVIGAISALGIYLFNDPKRNILINIGAGLWDTYNMVTGLLGDVLSYIRLYALGLAGAMLGAAFNTLGTMVLGDSPNIIMWLFFIMILIVGHALNLAMSVLGAFVHPLRLTFVEYFKNSGYQGKGEKYSPLTKVEL